MRPSQPEQAMQILVLIILALMPTLAHAHGGGLVMLFIGVPFAAMIHLLSATITRKLFLELHFILYWVLAGVLLLPGLAIYIFLCAFLIDEHNFDELLVSILMALLPLVAAVTFRMVNRKFQQISRD